MSGWLEGKTAIVTGASSGIGAGIAEVFAREGARLLLTYRANRAGVARTLEAVRRYGREALAVELELADCASIQAMITTAYREWGRIDVLVNNAGVDHTAPFMETTPELFDRTFAVDARGTYFCAQAAARVMIGHGGGKIINISTLHTRASSHHFSAYAASKAAIDQMTRGLAIELADHHIQVNAIAPGWIPTEREPVPPEMRSECLRYIPRGEFGTPQDIGELTAFLASDRSRHITGQIIYVDGGQSLLLAIPSREHEPEFHQRLAGGTDPAGVHA